jgi:hypothetical protein
MVLQVVRLSSSTLLSVQLSVDPQAQPPHERVSSYHGANVVPLGKPGGHASIPVLVTQRLAAWLGDKHAPDGQVRFGVQSVAVAAWTGG